MPKIFLVVVLLACQATIGMSGAFARHDRDDQDDGRYRQRRAEQQDRNEDRGDRHGRRERMSPDERRDFRRSIEDAGRDLYRRDR